MLRFADGEMTDLYHFERGAPDPACSYRDGKLVVNEDKSCETIDRHKGFEALGEFAE